MNNNNHIHKAVIQSGSSKKGRRKLKTSFKENRNGLIKITNRFASLKVEEIPQVKNEHDPINNFMISHVLASSDNNDKTDGIMNNMITSYENIFNTNFYFVCNNCGYKSNTLNWKCPSCNRWETMLPKSAIDVIRDGKINEPNKEK